MKNYLFEHKMFKQSIRPLPSAIGLGTQMITHLIKELLVSYFYGLCYKTAENKRYSIQNRNRKKRKRRCALKKRNKDIVRRFR